MKTILPLCLAAFLGAGCASVEITPKGTLRGLDVQGANGKADRQVAISCGGYYLFDRWPLVCGDVRWNDAKNDWNGGSAWFNDVGNLAAAHALLLKIAERENCDLCDVVYNDHSNTKLDLTSLQGWVSLLVNCTEISASAVLVPRDQSGAGNAVSATTAK